MKRFLPAAFLIAMAFPAMAQDPCPKPCDGKCLSQEQIDKLKMAVDELKDIHESPASVSVVAPVVIVRDWDGRVYVNGGSTIPLRAKVKIGKHVDRDLDVVLNSRVWYRPEPPQPMFRLRIKAQAGILAPEAINKVRGVDGTAYPLDAGIAWDFFHLGILNISAYTGIRSAGAGPGLDITRNFGMYAGYAILYDGFKSSAMAAAYFSFN